MVKKSGFCLAVTAATIRSTYVSQIDHILPCELPKPLRERLVLDVAARDARGLVQRDGARDVQRAPEARVQGAAHTFAIVRAVSASSTAAITERSGSPSTEPDAPLPAR